MKFFLLCVYAGLVLSLEPNPPTWPRSVVINPSQTKINSIYAEQGGHIPEEHGQWSKSRYALLFTPGSYGVDVPVGYYTTVHGLGVTPDQVIFTSAKGVFSEEGDYHYFPGALDDFWRSAENFKTMASFQWFSGTEGTGMLWAVSQAAPIRNVIVAHDLVLFEYQPPDIWAGMSSGGFMGNCKVGGKIHSGSQQQWLSRNSEFAGWTDGVWNIVYVGCQGTPSDHCGAKAGTDLHPYLSKAQTPLVAEKPYIAFENGKFNLLVPKVKMNSVGADHTAPSKIIPFEQVYVATASDSASTINEKLASGLHLVISPGIYHLTEPIKVVKSNQVILGLGMATLVPSNTFSVITVDDNLDGVRIAGLLLQAGPMGCHALLRWGTIGGYKGDSSNPGVISDVVARVGGPDIVEVKANVMFQINSGNVVIDNTWLWRADHSINGPVKNLQNPSITGLQVNGDNVIGYGLAVEHTLGDMLEWNGKNGKVYFFQSEYPYDVTQAQYGDKGYVAYRVNSTVTNHESYGAGVYHYFRDYAVTVKTGISCPPQLQSSFKFPLGVFLNGSGTMVHIINNIGATTSRSQPVSDKGAHPAWVC